MADIDLQALAETGIISVLVDMDNTLTHWGGHDVTPGMREFAEKVRAAGMRGCVLSNGKGSRVRSMAAELGFECVSMAGKPRRGAYTAAMALIGALPESTVMIGDQVFTDIYGGNRCGLRTILVDPVAERELPNTRLMRVFEGLAGRRRVGGPA